MRRARITEENTRRMYEDLLDRVVGDRGEEAEPPPAPAPSSRRSRRPSATAQDNPPPSQPPTTPRERIKATFYLAPEDVVTIDRIQTQEFLRTGKKPQRSEIVSRALRLLASQELVGEEA